MSEVITQLLILQDRDHKILQTQSELAGLGPQRQMLQAKAAAAQSHSEGIRARLHQLENERKQAELEVESNQQRIERYSLQQFQTKKNEEYRALAHEIETCKATITKLEDRQLDLMEQAEKVQKELAAGAQSASEAKKVMDSQTADLAAREGNLTQRLAELQRGRDQLAQAVDETTRERYERLLRHKGGKVVVGIDRGVCGGCHMTLPPQVLITCQSDQEIVSCPNCGRILFYTTDMDTTTPVDR
jgi:predicted  nucleic acid-binding Zn-ribbon protein